MGNTTITYTLAARIAQAAGTTTDHLGTVLVGDREILMSDDARIAQAVDEKSYQDLGLDLGPIEVLKVQGRKVHAWPRATADLAA